MKGLKKYKARKHQLKRYVSHAFRTSLAVIKSSVEVIEEIVKEDNRNLSPYLMRINRSLIRMESAISTTKALVWLLKGDKLDIPKEECYPLSIAEGIVQNYKALYQDKALEIDFIAGDNPVGILWKDKG